MKHQDTLATANRPFINVDDDSKGVHSVITKSYHCTVCTIFPEIITAGKEHNLYVCLSCTWQSEFSFIVLAANLVTIHVSI